jgi:hypothetical protein
MVQSLGVGSSSSNLDNDTETDPSSVRDTSSHNDVNNDIGDLVTGGFPDLEASRQGARQEDSTKNPVAGTVTAQDWSGPDDPENPQNWPLWKRVYTTSIPGLYGFTV